MGGPSSNNGSNDTDVSGAEAVTFGGTTYSDKKRKGYKKADYNPEKDDTEAKLDMFYETGATNIKNQVKTPTAALLTGPLQAGSRKNRQFFTDKVLGSKNYKGTTKDDFMNLSSTKQEEMYQAYMSGRQSGTTDAYGNKIGTGRNDSSLTARTKQKSIKSLEQPKAPSQMDNTGVKSELITADKTAPTETGILLANKKKGRRDTVLTSITGVDEEAKLSKKKLLG